MSSASLIDEMTLANLTTDIGKEAVILVIAQSIIEFAQRAVILEQAIISMDRLALQKIAHSVSGIAGTIGALPLRSIATNVEIQCKDNLDIVDIEHLELFKSLIVKSAQQLKVHHGYLIANV